MHYPIFKYYLKLSLKGVYDLKKLLFIALKKISDLSFNNNKYLGKLGKFKKIIVLYFYDLLLYMAKISFSIQILILADQV